MITAAAVLRIIELILEITLETIKGMPEAQKIAYWERHEKNMAFWQGIFERLRIDTPQP